MPSIDKCLVKNWNPDGCLYGTPGASPGYSGGPVVSGSDFCGIVLGSSSGVNQKSTFEDSWIATKEQCDVRILPFSTIKFAIGEAEAIGKSIIFVYDL